MQTVNFTTFNLGWQGKKKNQMYADEKEKKHSKVVKW